MWRLAVAVAILLTVVLPLRGGAADTWPDADRATVVQLRFAGSTIGAADNGECMKATLQAAVEPCTTTLVLGTSDHMIIAPSTVKPRLTGIVCETTASGGTWDAASDFVQFVPQWRSQADVLALATVVKTDFTEPIPSVGDFTALVVGSEASPTAGTQSLRVTLAITDAGVALSLSAVCVVEVTIP